MVNKLTHMVEILTKMVKFFMGGIFHGGTLLYVVTFLNIWMEGLIGSLVTIAVYVHYRKKLFFQTGKSYNRSKIFRKLYFFFLGNFRLFHNLKSSNNHNLSFTK